MSLTQREREMLERARRAGAPVLADEPDLGFSITVSPVTTNAIDVGTFVRLSEAMTRLARCQGFRCELSGIVMFPIVASPDVYSRKDFVTHKRASKSYFVGRNIAFTTWKRANQVRKLELAVANFEASLRAIPDKHLSNDNKQKLVELLKLAAASLAKS